MADPTTSPPLTPSGVRSAYTKIKRYIHTTPVLTSHALDAIASSPDPRLYLAENPPAFPSSGNHHDNDDATPKFKLYFKAENLQKIGAFKARGAFHAVTRLIDEVGLDEVRRRGVVTHSSGEFFLFFSFSLFPVFHHRLFFVFPLFGPWGEGGEREGGGKG